MPPAEGNTVYDYALETNNVDGTDETLIVENQPNSI